MEKRNNNIAISVVLAVHNGEDFLVESMESVLVQTFKDFELIVVNDGSTDGTLDIVDEFTRRDNRVKVFTVEKQDSLADALNVGIAHSSGKYIARMDHDDVMLPSRLSTQFEFMENNPGVVVCGGQIDFIDEAGKVIGTRLYPLDDLTLKRNLFLISPFAHPSVMIRKDALDKVGGYEKGLKKVEDIMLWFRLAKLGKFANVSEKVFKYRVRSNSESLGNKIQHFERTYNIRKRVIKEGIYEIDFRQKVLLGMQKVIVYITKILPGDWFMKIFEFGRKFLLRS